MIDRCHETSKSSAADLINIKLPPPCFKLSQQKNFLEHRCQSKPALADCNICIYFNMFFMIAYMYMSALCTMLPWLRVNQSAGVSACHPVISRPAAPAVCLSNCQPNKGLQRHILAPEVFLNICMTSNCLYRVTASANASLRD